MGGLPLFCSTAVLGTGGIITFASPSSLPSIISYIKESFLGNTLSKFLLPLFLVVGLICFVDLSNANDLGSRRNPLLVDSISTHILKSFENID